MYDSQNHQIKWGEVWDVEGCQEYLGKADTEAEGIYASVSGKRQNGGKF